MTVRKIAEIADFVQTFGQDVQAISTQEFDGLKRVSAQLAAPLVVLEAEGHLAVLQSNEVVVGDGDAVRVASQVLQDMRRVTRFFGVDHPFLLAQRRQQAQPRRGLRQVPAATRQGQLASAIEVLEPLKVEAPKASREHPHREEEVGPTRHPARPLWSQAPGGQDAVQVRVVLESATPRVEDRHATDLGAQMRGIAGDVQEALGHGAKEQAVERARIGEDQWAEVLRQGKNRMRVGRVQNFALPVSQPSGSGHALAFWAMPVATRVISASLMSAVVTASFVAAQGRRVAQCDGPKRPVLFAAEGVPIALQEGLAMLTHHIGHFEVGSAHGN